MSQELVLVTPPPAAPLAAAAPSSPQPTFLAPGFRFHPTDEELVRYYLRRKACRKPFRFEAVSTIDVYKFEPSELADHSAVKTRDHEWYFFSPVDKKYGNGSRLNRATEKGYWKATGKDRFVRHMGVIIGMKKTLVFHTGRAPEGERTDWVMHEYRLMDEELDRAGVVQDAFMLCRIFYKSGLGPPHGGRYAPFNEEEWEDDVAITLPGGDAEDDVITGGEIQLHGNDSVQETGGNLVKPQPIRFACKRERDGSEVESSITLFRTKLSKRIDPTANGNGSEDSTTSQDPRTTGALIEYPFLQALEEKQNSNPSASQQSFDASTLEDSIPPGYLKYLKDLENELMRVSKEKETLNLELMRARAMISVLGAQVNDLRRGQ